MKIPSLLCMILVSLSRLSFAADEVRISTSVLTIPDGVKLPGQVRTVTLSEWREILRSMSMMEGVPLFTAPAVTTTSGKTTKINTRRVLPEGFWLRRPDPGPPVASIEYTPKMTRGGIDLVGNFTPNRSFSKDDMTAGLVTAGRVSCLIPDGEVLTFQLGNHFFGVKCSKIEGKNPKP